MKFKLFEFENVTSTNDIAINLIKDKKRKTGCIYAKSQSKNSVIIEKKNFRSGFRKTNQQPTKSPQKTTNIFRYIKI